MVALRQGPALRPWADDAGAEAIHPIKLNDVDPYAYLAAHSCGSSAVISTACRRLQPLGLRPTAQPPKSGEITQSPQSSLRAREIARSEDRPE